MCRMFAVVSKTPISPSLLWDFQILAEIGKVPKGSRSGHRDGWGIVHYKDEEPRYLGRQPNNAFCNEDYMKVCERLAESQVAGTLLAHLRKRSIGPKTIENTAPFVRDKWCFAHNGSIRPYFCVPVEGERENMTDSERFLLLLLQEKQRTNRSVEQILKRVVPCMRMIFKEYTSLTFLLSNGKDVYAYRDFRENKDEDYYNLMYSKENNMILFAQEPLWKKSWVAIPNKCLVKADQELKITGPVEI